MEGFVKNKRQDWAYAMKRSIRPGGEIPLSELYEQYGVKYGIEPGKPFVEWLMNVKLKDRDQWEIVYDFDDLLPTDSTEKVFTSTNIEQLSEELDDVSTHKSAIKKLSVDDVARLSVRKARDVLPKVMDLKLLQYALTEARQLADKDSLCRLLDRRIKELQIAR